MYKCRCTDGCVGHFAASMVYLYRNISLSSSIRFFRSSRPSAVMLWLRSPSLYAIHIKHLTSLLRHSFRRRISSGWAAIYELLLTGTQIETDQIGCVTLSSYVFSIFLYTAAAFILKQNAPFPSRGAVAADDSEFVSASGHWKSQSGEKNLSGHLRY